MVWSLLKKYGLLILITVIVLGFLIPLFSRITLPSSMSDYFGSDSLIWPLFRSITLAFASTFICIILSAYLAINLRSTPLDSRNAAVLGLLMFPFLVGDVSSAYTWKLISIDLGISWDSAADKYLGLLLIQVWQFVPLFTYLFWLNQQLIAKSRLDYFQASRLSIFELARDEILPRQADLSKLLGTLIFLLTFYESTKMKFVFKGSRGTYSELLAQWLDRSYRTSSLVDVEMAIGQLAFGGLVSSLLAILSLAVIWNILNKGIKLAIIPFKVKEISVAQPQRMVPRVLLSLSVFPCFWVLITQLESSSWDFAEMGLTLSLTFIAAIVTALTSIGMAVYLRLTWQRTFQSFNRDSLFRIFMFVVLLAIPSLVLFISIFQWGRIIGYHSSTIIPTWLTAHTILSLPVLVAFSIAVHFRLNNSHIEYHNIHRASLLLKLNTLFLKAYKIDYLLIVLFAFSIIWNEAVINSALSDFIPSFSTEMNKTILGRNANYSKGAGYLLISVTIASVSIIVWNLIVNRIRKHQARL